MRWSNAFETLWLAKALTEKWKASGMNRSRWLRSLNLGDNAETHVSYLLSGKRGLSFGKAVRIATKAGIDLAPLQELIRWRS